jgi:hypothetical protein
MALPSDANMDFLVCDAVRQSAEGKLDLAGYFPTREVKLDAAAQLPVAVNLTFVFVLKDGDGPFKTTCHIVDPLDNELHRFDVGEFRKSAGQAHVLMLPVGMIPVAHSGNYSVVLELNGEPYRRSVRIHQ